MPPHVDPPQFAALLEVAYGAWHDLVYDRMFKKDLLRFGALLAVADNARRRASSAPRLFV